MSWRRTTTSRPCTRTSTSRSESSKQSPADLVPDGYLGSWSDPRLELVARCHYRSVRDALGEQDDRPPEAGFARREAHKHKTVRSSIASAGSCDGCPTPFARREPTREPG